MMNRNLIIIVIGFIASIITVYSFITGNLRLEDIFNPKLSSELSSSKVIFHETFSNNNSKWHTNESTDRTYEISNGSYRIDNRTVDKYLHDMIDIGLSKYEDFMLMCYIEKTSGVDNDTYDLIWGSDESKHNYYTFGITGNGSYQIEKHENDEWSTIIDYKSSKYIITKNALNKLTIIKDNDLLLFYINDEQVESMKYQPVFGSYVGFGASSNVEIKVKEVIVRGR